MNRKKMIRLVLIIFHLLLQDEGFAQADYPPSDSIINAKCGQWTTVCSRANWDSAIYYGQQIAALSKNLYGEKSHGHAVALVTYLGFAYAVAGDQHNAYDYLKKGMGIFVALGDTVSARYESALLHFGVVCYGLGANTEALPFLEKAAAACQRKSDMRNYAQCMVCIAAIWADGGAYARAEAIDISTMEMLKGLPVSGFRDYLLGSIYNNIAIVYSNTGNQRKALQAVQKAERIEREPGTGVAGNDYLTILLNLAGQYTVCGFTDSALVKCKQVEDSLAVNNNDLLLALLTKERGRIYQQQRRLPEAIRQYKLFKAMMDTAFAKPSDYDATLINLGMIYVDTKQYKAADTLFRKELEQLRNRGLEYSYEMQQSQAGLCANLIAMKKYDEAADSILVLCRLALDALNRNFPGMPESDQLNYRAGLDGFFDLLYTCLQFNQTHRRELITAAFKMELYRKKLVLSSQVSLLNEARNATDSSLPILYAAWLNNRQVLSRQYSLPASQRYFNTDSLENICERLEEQVSSRGLHTIVALNQLSIENLLRRQSAGSAAIAFIRYSDKATRTGSGKSQYAAFVFRYNDSVPVFVRLCSEEALVKLMKDAHGKWIDKNALTQKIYNTGNDALSLYRLVWQPLETSLQGITNIDYSTAEMFNNIAVNAIYDGHQYLVNRYTLHCYASLRRESLPDEKRTTLQNAAVWGNMNYDSAVYTGHLQTEKATGLIIPGIKAYAQSKKVSKSPLLPFKNDELPAIKKIFSSNHISYSSFEGYDATEEGFKSRAAAAAGILHVSTHGFYFPDAVAKDRSPAEIFLGVKVNPLFRCGLAFSGVNYYWMKGTPKADQEDGILTGYEVAQLDLHKVDLVTLSACETALGDITSAEGNLGLVRAFKMAGARKLLVSLWEVPAKQTAALLAVFYTNLLQGTTAAEALQLAERNLQQQHYPPFYWAGFVLIE